MFALPFELPAERRDDPAASGLALLAERLCALPGLCWLDGDASHATGRFSFLAAAPVERIVVPFGTPDPLAAFARMEPAAHTATGTGMDGAPLPHEVPRFVGYVAYDALDPRGRARHAPASDRAALSFARYDALLAVDHVHGRGFIVGDDAAACERLRVRLSQPTTSRLRARAGALQAAPPEQHRHAIARALEHIAAGDVYQVNLARSFVAAFEGAPLVLWNALRKASPVPLGCYFDDGARVVMARTMERFLHWQRAERVLRARPIKGTIARAGDRDAEEAAALCADDKERAEHTMIVDLMRNDLGRVAVIGSVGVPEWMAVEPFARLSHLVSTVSCRTRPEIGLRDVLAATFPPGSVTGTPKLRAVELIAELEPEPRDVYTGALGFVDRCGGLSLAVAIRTAVVAAGELRYFAGGGIVEASQIDRELAETELKAQVLRDALAELAND